MTRAEITQTIIVLLFGGTEPTASGMSGLTYNLITHPDVLAKLTAEIEDAFKSEDEITNAKCTQLPYMNAVIQESLRVFPPAPCRFPRRTEAGGVEVDGWFVPGDVSIHNLLSPQEIIAICGRLAVLMACVLTRFCTGVHRGPPISDVPLRQQFL